ncbi:protein kinase [Histomonas meleagridis]|uniref:protein kinase n=1 Tax=Histomonas meleagridis TaxID=135588 RepID=UPI00355A71C7|nr:protein kinase [Histomonas meleagridis]KAH0800802.1 protein kinase [Histomonas meleagridis]
MRKLRHPRILKIYEVNEKSPIGFSAEPVSSILSSQTQKMHPLDAAYISYQVAEALYFLNQDAQMAHLGINPNSILLTKDFSIRLWNFQWSVALSSTGQPTPISKSIISTTILNDIRYHAPEILNNEGVTSKTDVFEFGLLSYTCFTGTSLNTETAPNKILGSLPTLVSSLHGPPQGFLELIKGCLQFDPSNRPTFSEIIQSPLFQTMQFKSLKYIDSILVKEPADKFKFYKGLSSKIDEFSPNIQRIKLLPIFLSECKTDVRYAPVLIKPIITIGESMSNDDFLNVIWIKLTFLTTITTPIEIPILLLRNLNIILKKVDKRYHKDYIFPIIVTSLQTNDPKIHKECLQSIGYFIDEMNETNINQLILPKLLALGSHSNDSNICTSIIENIIKCLPKINNDNFASEMLPKLNKIWENNRTNNVGEATVKLFRMLKASHEILMRKAIPVAAQIAGTHVLNEVSKDNLCDWMVSVIQRFKEDKEPKAFESRSKFDSDNPFDESKAPPNLQNAQTKSNPIIDDVFGDSNKIGVQKNKSNNDLDDIFGMFSNTQSASTNQSNTQSNTFRTNNQNNTFGMNSNTQSQSNNTFGFDNTQSTMNKNNTFGYTQNASNQNNSFGFGSNSQNMNTMNQNNTLGMTSNSNNNVDDAGFSWTTTTFDQNNNNQPQNIFNDQQNIQFSGGYTNGGQRNNNTKSTDIFKELF